MKTFRCRCGNRLYFENYRCLSCGRDLGFVPERAALLALEPDAGGYWRPVGERGARYRKCRNYEEESVCNWLVAEGDENVYCKACRLNRIIPDLSDAKNRQYWYEIEAAKRRLLYTLYQLRLPVVGKDVDPDGGLAFAFLADPVNDPELFEAAGGANKVMTGHRTGLITLNIAEADPSERERIREQMQERYRTLLGHFRHEIGHYYWDRLVRDGHWLAPWRELFGDETADYSAALRRYYESGPPPDWQERFVSAYASAHPWEDWAETWAHYLHMVDALETAANFGFSVQGAPVHDPVGDVLQAAGAQGAEAPRATAFEKLLENWIDLSLALNSINRSMGLPDAYPFVIGTRVRAKLRFVHEVIAEAAAANAPSRTSGVSETPA